MLEALFDLLPIIALLLSLCSMHEGSEGAWQLLITDVQDSEARFALRTQVQKTIPQSGNRLKRNDCKLC